MATAPAQADRKPAIQVERLTAAYGDRTVVQNLSFEVQWGEIFVIAGGSGSGKSTVLKSLIGLQRPAEGRVLIDGEDVHAAGPAERRRILRKFGVAFQGGALFGNMSVLENVRLPMEEFTSLSGAMMDMIGLAKLKLVGLEQAARKLPAELSGGMQKRVAIARALALDPAILFLDEPSAGLDPITSAGLDQLIVDFNDLLKTTFVVVTHELPSIFTIAHRVMLLDATVKTMVALDHPVRLRDASPNPWVRAFFNRQPITVPEQTGGAAATGTTPAAHTRATR